MLRHKLTNRFGIHLLVCLFLVGFASTVFADERDGPTRKVPHGSVAGISDWALAGIVWSDASLAKKIAVAAAKQTKDKTRLADLTKHIRRFDRILESMKEFGWQQLHVHPALASKSVAAKTTSTKQATSKESDLAEASSRYRESVKIAEEIDKGALNGPGGPANAADIKLRSGLAAQRYTVRDGQTLSESLPFSRNPLYHVEEYNPSSMGAGRTAAPNNPVDAFVTKEVNRLQSSQGQTLDSSARNRVRQTNLTQFTETDVTKHADANWVQFQLDSNQLHWNRLADATISDDMLADAIIRLRARMQLAAQFTKNDQLRSALTQ